MIEQPFKLPCGAILPNRLVKAAMTEGLADPQLRATERHVTLYRRWSEGGAGLLISGNVQIDRWCLERPANVAIDVTAGGDSADARERLKKWAQAGKSAGNHLWMQIAHAGRQAPRYVSREPLAPSAVQLDLFGNYARPRAITEEEILDFIQRFARVAVVARECGFTGAQVHSAHGYLLSSFLSPVTNQRTDAWGGSVENRARFLLEIVRAMRKAAGADFPISVKLNSDDFRKGGFTIDECLEVVRLLNPEKLDLLEVSGGSYEQPRLLGFIGREKDAMPMRESTRKREAYFLEYAAAIRKVATMPLMVTGGFRTRAAMDEALADGVCDVIGLGRPLCTHTDTPKKLLNREIDAAPQFESTLHIARRGLFSPTSPVLFLKAMNIMGAMGWYYQQLFRLADGLEPDLKRGVVKAYFAYFQDELSKAKLMRAARSAAGNT